MINNYAVIILASGLSQRLGQSKQFLSKDNQLLICYMTKLALAAQPQTVIVVIPQDNPEIAAAIAELATEYLNIITVNNPIPKTGMAHSLYLGIDALISIRGNIVINRVLIMGVDQVLLDNHHLAKLLAGERAVVASSYPHLYDDNKNFAIDKSKADIVGLPINIDYSLLKQWQVELTGDKGLRYLIRSLPSNQISTVINQQLSYDIDTPEQLIYAKQQHWLDQ